MAVWRRPVVKAALTAAAVVLAALVVAACGSSTMSSPSAKAPSSSSTSTTLPLTAANCPSLTTSSGTATSVTAPGGTTTTTVPKKAIFCRKGTGKAVLTGITTPKIPKWTLAWHFDCSNIKGGKGPFVLTLHPSGGKPEIKVASQDGLGGGGSNFYAPGTYSVGVSTACQWTVTGLT